MFFKHNRYPSRGQSVRTSNIYFFGDMTLVTYRRKSFSMREDDSCAPHSPHTLCQYNRLDRLAWEGLGFLLSLSSILNNFERSFIYFSKKKKKKNEVQNM